ncbi:hypothetical protein FJT64_012411 [Amphibalanus amphitrite]|uniref:WAP domain-containing protein n=1 Tax=Amphibalanus amphitrite TaxID=1232801 RepID=A0A6A4UZM4_AMPAM|nr:hypothetical protein FJT64_012411 [Amphibalanus amphitrite]
MKLLLLSLSLVVVLGEHEDRHALRHAQSYPDSYYPDRHYPGPYPDPYPGTGNPYVRPSGCKNWCRYDDNYRPGLFHGRTRYYCCDHSAPVVYPRPPYPYPTRQKICPPSPAVCTRVYSAFGAPTECYSDSECSTVDLCCYDVCLRHKTCKTADYTEGPVRPRPVPYRPRPGNIFTGIIGSLLGRSSFDEPHSVAAADQPQEVVALRSAKADGKKKHE